MTKTPPCRAAFRIPMSATRSSAAPIQVAAAFRSFAGRERRLGGGSRATRTLTSPRQSSGAELRTSSSTRVDGVCVTPEKVRPHSRSVVVPEAVVPGDYGGAGVSPAYPCSATDKLAPGGDDSAEAGSYRCLHVADRPRRRRRSRVDTIIRLRRGEQELRRRSGPRSTASTSRSTPARRSRSWGRPAAASRRS